MRGSVYVMLPRAAERFLLALAGCPVGEWLRAARAQEEALEDARVALAAASLRRAVERAAEGDAAVVREVERRVVGMLGALGGGVDDGARLPIDALASMRGATLTAAVALALGPRLKPLDVALLTSAFDAVVPTDVR